MVGTSAKLADFLRDRKNFRISKHRHEDASVFRRSSDESSCNPFDIAPRLSFCRSNNTAILHSSWARTGPKRHYKTHKYTQLHQDPK